MSNAEPPELTPRQKVSLTFGLGVLVSEAVEMTSQEFEFNALLQRGTTPANLMCSGLRAGELRLLGFTKTAHYKRLGFDALHLVDASFCEDLKNEFGSDAVLTTFLTSAGDAVALAGSQAAAILGCSTERLLRLCAGFPTEACEVLRQSSSASLLEGVSARTLLDTGLRSGQLASLGLGVVDLKTMSDLEPSMAAKFGFKL